MPRKIGSTLKRPQSPAQAPRKRKPRAPDPVAPAADLDPLAKEFDGTLPAAKHATEKRRAALLEIEVQLRRGELIRKTEVDKHSFATARTLRNRVLAISPRIAAEAFAAESVADCQRVLDRELRLALQSLSEDLEHGRA